MQPSICKESDLGISIPEDCDLSEWLIPVGKVEDIKTPSRYHAYITSDNKIYVLNQQGTGLAVLEENAIENITQNGILLNVVDKAVNIEVPTKTSDLINDTDFVSDANYVATNNNFTNENKEKLENIEDYAQVNLIEEVKVNENPLPVTNKSVTLDLSLYEKKENKVNEINETASPTQYASAKAVYDYVQSNRVQPFTYSLEEQLTEQCWIDGKPIFIRTFSAPAVARGAIGSINIGSGMSTVFIDDALSYLYTDNAQLYISPQFPNKSGVYAVNTRINNTKTAINIECGDNISIGYGYITIRYTKI